MKRRRAQRDPEDMGARDNGADPSRWSGLAILKVTGDTAGPLGRGSSAMDAKIAIGASRSSVLSQFSEDRWRAVLTPTLVQGYERGKIHRLPTDERAPEGGTGRR